MINDVYNRCTRKLMVPIPLDKFLHTFLPINHIFCTCIAWLLAHLVYIQLFMPWNSIRDGFLFFFVGLHFFSYYYMGPSTRAHIAIPITISGVSRDVSQSLLTRGWTWGHCGYQFNQSLIHRTCCCCLIRYLLSVLIYCCLIWFFHVKNTDYRLQVGTQFFRRLHYNT